MSLASEHRPREAVLPLRIIKGASFKMQDPGLDLLDVIQQAGEKVLGL